MKSKLFGILACALKMLSEFKRVLITSKKERKKNSGGRDTVCQYLPVRVAEVIFNCSIFIFASETEFTFKQLKTYISL